ncbi:phage tail tape measure protein [Pseudomonas aeruginosa]|uniref:phage tail tape measure protein n=1 Tax=Pseudomonas aeruginosa TaxID=287 RepID=UPI000F5223EA|nr:phage tail tape measure protein [Pseudomonas aeruginosa]MDA3279901.1 phage tail tape measure protein [Pseudomonas aeruginosa]RPY40377.1 phage tail tape measure protein [Pseudomonas aeruginosa]WCV99362.1 phage tail tape measure protein [Pseudomonas aeruginosa]
MAESKYSLRLAAVDAYSSTFGDFTKKGAALREGIKAQQAALQKLNREARTLDGYGKLSEKLAGTKTALQEARVEQVRLGREHQVALAKVEQLTMAHEKAASAHRALASSTEATAGQVRKARAEEARLAAELKSAESNVAKLNTTQDKATASVRTLAAAQRAQRNELTRLQADLTAAGVDTSKLASEQKRLEAATTSANAALAAQRAKLDAVKGAQGRIEENRNQRADLRGQMVETAALAYVASRPINQAMELETAMADVGKVINFEEGGREKMAAANLKMASDRMIASSGMTAVDLAKIEYAAGQSGIGNDQKDKDGKVDPAAKERAIMDFTRDAAIMGSAFDIDAQTAGETMAGWRASMGLDRAQTLDLADSTNYLGNNFNAKAADIAAVVKRYGAVGKASGLTPEQSAALSAALLNPGTEKEIAGTGFKNFTSALVAGKSATKGEKEQWKELGFDPEDLAADMQKNAPDTIMRVLEAIKEQPREEQAAIATNLFGSESIGAIQPLLENLGEVRKAFDMVADKSKYATSVIGEQGSMMQEAAGVANTSRTGWNSFTAKLTRLSTLVGNAMLPALNAVLTPLGVMVDGLSWAAETFPGITGAIAVAAAGLTALKLGAIGMKYVGLMFGQGANRGALARAKLDARTAQTATVANAAVARLNASIGGLGGGPGAAAGRGGAAAGRGGAAGAAAAKGGRLARLSSAGGKVMAPLLALAGLAEVAMPAPAAPSAARPTSAKPGEFLRPAAAPGAPIAGKALTIVGPVVPGAAPGAPAGAAKPALSLVPKAAGVAPVAVPGAPGALKPALSLVPAAAGAAPLAAPGAALSAAAVAEKAPGMLGKAAGLGGGAVKLLGKAATPLMLLSGVAEAADGIQKGDAGQVGGAVGGMAGGWGGAAAGAAIGTMILPGIGTAVGGLIGSIAGSELGSWIGDKLGSAVGSVADKLKSPEETAAAVVKSSEERKEINFSPSITLQPSGDPAYDKMQADKIIARLKAELLPMLGGADQLAVRRSSSLTDGSD